MNKTIKMAAAVITLVLVAASCGGGDEESTDETKAAASGQTITVGATEFAFDPSAFEVSADSEFTVEVVNGGVIEHNFVITGYDDDTIAVPVGVTASGSFTLSAGSYEFFCSIAGHKESGMLGTLTVK